MNLDYAARCAYPYRPASDVRVGEIEHCIARGMTTHEAARALNVRRHGLCKQARRLGLHWPNRQHGRDRCVWAFGRWWNFAEIAREAGATRVGVRRRYLRGDRGESLFRAPRRVADDGWELGLSGSDWGAIVEYAQTHSAHAAADLFDVPIGAVNAALRGEWELLG